jgi:hypothetical protein
MADGFSMEKHPILDGEYSPPQLVLSAIHGPPQEHHVM